MFLQSNEIASQAG